MKLRAFMEDSFAISKGSVKINIGETLDKYKQEYDLLAANASHTFRHMLYTVTPGNRKIVHIKVPSKSVVGFHYDVLLELSAEKTATDFLDADIKVFSNSPSFVYSVAYVFAHWDPDAKASPDERMMHADTLAGSLPKNRMLVPGSERLLGGARRPSSKDPDRAKNSVYDQPVVRNPMGIPLFDKTVYQAIFYMMNELTLQEVMGNHNNVSASRVFNSIYTFDRLMNERKLMERKQREEKKAQRVETEKPFVKHERNLAKQNASGMQSPKSMKSTSAAVKKVGSIQARTTVRPKTTRRK